MTPAPYDSKPELREILRQAISYYLKEHNLYSIFQRVFKDCPDCEMEQIPHAGGTKTRRELLDSHRAQLAQYTAAGIYLESLFKNEDTASIEAVEAVTPQSQRAIAFMDLLRSMGPENRTTFIKRINDYAPERKP